MLSLRSTGACSLLRSEEDYLCSVALMSCCSMLGHSFCVRRLVLSCAARPVASRNFHGEWLGRRSGIDIPIQKSQPADHRLFNSKINDALQRHNVATAIDGKPGSKIYMMTRIRKMFLCSCSGRRSPLTRKGRGHPAITTISTAFLPGGNGPIVSGRSLRK